MINLLDFIYAVETLKQNYGNEYFKKIGLHAVLNDLSPRLDKKFINVLKKADDFSLCIKINNLETENDSIKTIELAKYRQDFVENSGLDNTLAILIFDTYLFGLDLKRNLKIEDYKSKSHNQNLFLKELIDMALVDKKLEKGEIKNIFSKCQKHGLTEDNIFNQLVAVINQFKLKPLQAKTEVKLKDKSILLKYDWVDQETIYQEQQNQSFAILRIEQEKIRQAALQKEKSLAEQKEKELELKKLELDLKKREQEEKESAQKLNLVAEALKVKQEKSLRRKEGYKNLLLHKGLNRILAHICSAIIFLLFTISTCYYFGNKWSSLTCIVFAYTIYYGSLRYRVSNLISNFIFPIFENNKMKYRLNYKNTYSYEDSFFKQYRSYPDQLILDKGLNGGDEYDSWFFRLIPDLLNIPFYILIYFYEQIPLIYLIYKYWNSMY
jgi:hypothetical protein